ncbi:MAG: ABC transporter permease, partial [Blastocatellia bacterium]
MRLQEEDVRPGGWADSSILIPTNPFALGVSFVNKTLAIVELEIRRLRHDFTELITRAVQPMLWLLLFGSV